MRGCYGIGTVTSAKDVETRRTIRGDTKEAAKCAQLTTLTLMVVFTAGLGAQKPTPTPQMDSRGLPLPFGVQPYDKPDYPLGSGPYKAIMATESGLPAPCGLLPGGPRATRQARRYLW